MNTRSLLLAAAFAAAPLAAGAATIANAATVNLSNWAYGDSWGNQVQTSGPAFAGAAGGFRTAIRFEPGNSYGFSGTLNNVVTYCVELEEGFTLPSGNLAGFSVVDGAGNGKWADANGSGKTALAVSNRLGQLMAYVASDATLVDTKAESTSLQLAIWNVIYDRDDTVLGGAFRETGGAAFDAYADVLLQASAGYGQMLDVYVLGRSGTQDLLFTRDGGRAVRFGIDAGIAAVPEPASLALAALALGAAGAARRRRR